MSLYLTKVLALLALPLGWAVLLGFSGLLLLALGRRRAAGWVIALQLGLLWVCAMPWMANWLTAWGEAAYLPVGLEQTPVADVAIVLGGALRDTVNPSGENLNDASDRVLRAARLFRAGKVGHILAVGGCLPWLSRGRPEAEAMRDLLAEWGVPREAVVTETTSANTRENALFAAEIVRGQGWNSALLVTSAAHMTRAVGAFRGARLEVIPSPTDYRTAPDAPLGLLNFLPDAEALERTSAVLRETIGLWSYRSRGWIQ